MRALEGSPSLDFRLRFCYLKSNTQYWASCVNVSCLTQLPVYELSIFRVINYVVRELHILREPEKRNEHIFITGIIRLVAELDQIKSLNEFGIETSSSIMKNERMFGSFNQGSPTFKSSLLCLFTNPKKRRRSMETFQWFIGRKVSQKRIEKATRQNERDFSVAKALDLNLYLSALLIDKYSQVPCTSNWFLSTRHQSSPNPAWKWPRHLNCVSKVPKDKIWARYHNQINLRRFPFRSKYGKLYFVNLTELLSLIKLGI